jgi:hypothetical protein
MVQLSASPPPAECRAGYTAQRAPATGPGHQVTAWKGLLLARVVVWGALPAQSGQSLIGEHQYSGQNYQGPPFSTAQRLKQHALSIWFHSE